MAKYRERIRARKLRREGKSVGEITKLIGVSKSSISVWCRDIELTQNQIDKLVERDRRGGVRGRMVAAKNRRAERVARELYYERVGIEKVDELSKRELFITGCALYWAEGAKRNFSVSFINSDPAMILIFMKWLRECLGISVERLRAVVGINAMHINRVGLVERYWSELTSIPLSQFTKPSIKKVKNLKIYRNNDRHYGNLTIKVLKSTNLLYEIKGYLIGLKYNVDDKIVI